jgi:hypothetical protein
MWISLSEVNMALSPELENMLRNLNPDETLQAYQIISDKLAALGETALHVWTPIDAGNAISVFEKLREERKRE